MTENILFSHVYVCYSLSIANRLIMVDGDWNPATGKSIDVVHIEFIYS